MIAEAIKKLAHREDLSSSEAEAAMDSIMQSNFVILIRYAFFVAN